MVKIFIFIFFIIISFMLGMLISGKVFINDIKKERNLADKHFAFFVLQDHWLEIKQTNGNFGKYFEKYGYKKIAIYGMGRLGIRLFYELKDSDVEVAYMIDKKIVKSDLEVPCYIPSGDLPPVDIIVVTPITYYLEIEKNMKNYTNCLIISLDDIVKELIEGD